jgi:hypothetical protein
MHSRPTADLYVAQAGKGKSQCSLEKRQQLFVAAKSGAGEEGMTDRRAPDGSLQNSSPHVHRTWLPHFSADPPLAFIFCR